MSVHNEKAKLKADQCPIDINGHCPISNVPTSSPECARVDSGKGVTILCAGQSPYWPFTVLHLI